MMRTRKLPMIKSYSQRLRTQLFYDLLYLQTKEDRQPQHHQPQPISAGPINEPQEEEDQDFDIGSLQEEEVEFQGDEEEMAVADYIQMLSPKDREQFKKENPQLPPLFFMSRAEKKKYFEQLNKSFRQEISKTPQRKSKTKKILKFRSEFEVKHFNEHEKVVALGKAKQVKEDYHHKIHFS